MNAAPLYPVFMKLARRKVVVVGGGDVAASKVEALLRAEAHVTVVAPEIGPEIARAGVALARRSFRPEDLDGAWFVVAAATPEVNRQVAEAAEARRVFVNAVDDPAQASAYLGSVLRREGVTVAFSTEGHAPALVALLREALDTLLPKEVDEWLDEARRQRGLWRTQGVPMSERRPLLLEALNRLYEERLAAPGGKR